MLRFKLIIAVLGFTVKVQTEECMTVYNETGKCIPLHSCHELFQLANNGSAGEEIIEKSICGGTKFSPKVCCGFSANFTQPKELISKTKKTSLLASRTYCGYQHSDDYGRQENETAVRINEFPWLAHLLYKDKKTGKEDYLCVGSLINNKYILTAAHCIKEAGTKEIIGVRLGEYYYTNKSDCVEDELVGEECSEIKNYEIAKITTHTLSAPNVNDIALIRLNKRVEYSDYIRPICLPEPGRISAKVGDSLISSGWGRTFTTGRSELKKKSFYVMVSNEDCAQTYKNYANITENHICSVLSKNSSDPQCFSDSGGPVMFSQGFQWQQEGIVSFGARRCGSTTIPDVSTRVVNYLTWIEENLEP